MIRLSSFVTVAATMLLLTSSCALPLSPNEDAISTAIVETQQVATLNALIQTATQYALGPAPSDTPAATNSPAPRITPTVRPSATPRPRWPILSIEKVEGAFQEAGYSRYPFTTEDGYSALMWIKDNNYFHATTVENGEIEIQVLHDRDQNVRIKGVEEKFGILDHVFPSDFMTVLRESNDEFNRSISGKVTGEPDKIRAFDDQWNTVWAEYNAKEVTIGSYIVRFSLWWWQSTCPSGYHCYYSDFPGLDFEGDASITFYTIRLTPIEDCCFPEPSL